MEQKTCPGCRQTKPIGEFNWRKKSQGKRQVYCRACTQKQLQRHYHENVAYYTQKARRRNQLVTAELQCLVLAYLAEHPCVDCGETDVVCLEFDHVRGEKVAEISHMLKTSYSWAAVKTEIEKCEVRCANCHRRKTARELGWYRVGG